MSQQNTIASYQQLSPPVFSISFGIFSNIQSILAATPTRTSDLASVSRYELL